MIALIKSIILNLKFDIAKFTAKTPTAAPIAGTNKRLWEQPITRDKTTTNIAVMITAYFFIVINPYKKTKSRQCFTDSTISYAPVFVNKIRTPAVFAAVNISIAIYS